MAVTDEAIEKIKEMIGSGRLRPGDRLPREDELASDLGLSRSSLREAVRALSLVRILDVRQRDGTYVTSRNGEVLLDAVSFVIDFHRDDSVSNFVEFRRMLEPQATAIVARSATAEQVAELRAILQRGSLSLPTEMFVDIDREFHQTLNSYCGNPIVDAIENHQPEVAAARAVVDVAGVEDWLKGFRSHLNGRESGPDAGAAGG